MKTKLYYLMLIILAILMEGCVEKTPNVSDIKDTGITPYGWKIESFEIDGHEYLNIHYGYTHAGTCKKCKQERDSIVKYIIKELK